MRARGSDEALNLAPRLAPAPPPDTPEGIDLGRRVPVVKIPLPWAKVALILPRSVAEDILAWAEREAEDVPMRLVLTKVKQGGVPHIEASTSQTYRKRRP